MLSAGLEPATLALLAPCSTDWATRAYIIPENMLRYIDNNNSNNNNNNKIERKKDRKKERKIERKKWTKRISGLRKRKRRRRRKRRKRKRKRRILNLALEIDITYNVVRGCSSAGRTTNLNSTNQLVNLKSS